MAGLRTVAMGLVLVLVSLCVDILSVNLFVGSAVVAGWADRFGGGHQEAQSFGLLSGILSGLGLLLDLGAKFLCLWTPRKLSATRYLYASLALQVLGFCCLGNGFAAEFFRGSSPLSAVGCFFVPSWALASVLFLVFLSRLADAVRRRDLARAGTSVLFWSILSVVSATALFVAFAVVNVSIARLILLGPALATFVVSIVTVVRYVILLVRLRIALLAVAERSGGYSDAAETAREPPPGEGPD
jgi:hypothetical protein